MDVEFSKKQLKKDDDGFEYDVRKDFDEGVKKVDDGWDDY